MTAYLASRYSAARQLAAGDDATDWRTRAACLDQDPELFFPVGNSPAAWAQAEQAKQICRRCPVTAECGQLRVDLGVTDGVWGGTSEGDRTAPQRRAAYERSRAVRQDGRLLALEHGLDILTAAQAGMSERGIATQYGTTVEAARRALRILRGAHGLTMKTLTVLERVLSRHESLLRESSAARRSDREIARALRITPGTVRDALTILAARDAAAAWAPEEAAA